MNTSTICESVLPKPYHPGVCQFVLGDGAVRAIAVSINTAVLGDLAARADGHVIPGDVLK